jgi:prevent-host-death family protein
MDILTPTSFRKNMYQTLKEVASHAKEVEIVTSSNESVVLISKADWNSLHETLYLENSGTLDIVRERIATSTENDFEEF